MKTKILTALCTMTFLLCCIHCAAQERFVRIMDDSTSSYYMISIAETGDSLLLINPFPKYDSTIVTLLTPFKFQTRFYKFDKNNVNNPYRQKTYIIDTAKHNQAEPFCILKKEFSTTYISTIFTEDTTDITFGTRAHSFVREINNLSLDSINSKVISPIPNVQAKSFNNVSNKYFITFLNRILDPNPYNDYISPRYTLACYDTSFNLIWQKSDYTTPHNGNFMSSDILDAPNNQLIVGGTETWNYWDGIFPNGQPNYQNELYANGYIWKLDSVGNRLWSKMLPYRDSTVTREPLLKALPDSSFLAIYTETFNNYGNQEISDSAGLRIAKYDYDGNLLWCKRLKEDLLLKVGYTYGWMNGFVSFATQLLDLADNKLLLLLNTEMAGLLIKMDYSGNIDWARQIEADTACVFSQTYVYDVDIATDSSFYMCGNVTMMPTVLYCPQVTQYRKTGFIMHLDKYGCLEPGCQLTDGINKIQFKSEILVYPNPTENELNITYGGVFNNTKPVTISIANYTGQIVSTNNYTTTFANIDLQNLPKGLYLVTLQQQGKQSVTRKVIKN